MKASAKLWSLWVLVALLWNCSNESGTGPGSGEGQISGVLTAETEGGSADLAGGDGDPFRGGAPLRDASVRLLDGEGNVLFDSETDARGTFELEVPAGTFRLEVAVPGAAAFVLQVTVDAGEHLFIRAKVREAGSRFVIDAELFTDNDDDGASDSGLTIQIIGREAGRPDSGEVRGGRGDDDEDDDDEDEDDKDVSFARFLARVLALGGSALNHDLRGSFGERIFDAEKLTVSDEARREIEVIASIHNLDARAGTFSLLGIPVLTNEATELKGNLRSLGELSDGSPVRVKGRAEARGLVATEIQPANRRDDRLRGGTLIASTDAPGEGPEFTVSIAGVEIPVDVDRGTELEVED
jgi:hypothetical protein